MTQKQISKVKRANSFFAMVLMLVVGSLASQLCTTQVFADQRTEHAAVNLVQQSLLITQRGVNHRMLQSLRHLKDPELRPLFQKMVNMPNQSLKIHGILGLAEISDSKKIDITLLAEIGDDYVLGQVITNAMDEDLVDEAQLVEMLKWNKLDLGVKLLILTRNLQLVNDSTLPALEESLSSKKLGRVALAAYILNEAGYEEGAKQLQLIDASDDPQRDPVRAQLLAVALQNDYEKYTPWAVAMAQDESLPLQLRHLAMKVALRFNASGAEDVWTALYNSNDDLVYRTRLALDALSMSPFMTSSKMYDYLKQSDVALLRQIGATGEAVALKSDSLEEYIVNLIDMQYQNANAWAIKYANHHANADDARFILVGLVVASESGDPRFRSARLMEAAGASQYLYELDPAYAADILVGLLENPETKSDLKQAILLGLVRSTQFGAGKMIGKLSLFNPDANALALLLRAREYQELSKVELQDLASIIRGGSKLQDSLRVQAAWLYLKYMGVSEPALGAVLAD